LLKLLEITDQLRCLQCPPVALYCRLMAVLWERLQAKLSDHTQLAATDRCSTAPTDKNGFDEATTEYWPNILSEAASPFASRLTIIRPKPVS